MDNKIVVKIKDFDNVISDALLVINDFGNINTLNFQYKKIIINVNDVFPFIALQKLRIELEKINLSILCEGARKDVYPSGMQLESYFAYIIKLSEPATETVYIYDFTSSIDQITSVSEQDAFYEEWLDSVWPE